MVAFSPFFFFFFPSLHFADRRSATVSMCTFHICKTCKIYFKYNSGKGHWILDPLYYNLWQTFPVIVIEIKSTVQVKFLDCLSLEKLKKNFLVENSSHRLSVYKTLMDFQRMQNRFLIFSCLNSNIEIDLYLNQGGSKEYFLQLQTSV